MKHKLTFIYTPVFNNVAIWNYMRYTLRKEKQGLNISTSTNLKICNLLDVTLNLTDGTHYPYRKPNNETLYIDTNSNHPPTIIKHLPAAIGRRIPDISSSKELFNKAKLHYESALKQSGQEEKLIYTERKNL